MKVKIIFPDFDLPPAEEQCIEYVKLKNQEEPVARFYCGSSLPPEFISSGNKVTVEFKTNQNKGKHRGFFLTYEAEAGMFNMLVWYAQQ